MTWILPRQLHTLACALDTAALSLDCTEQSEVCAQSLFVRSKPSPLRTWSAKWKRDSWTQHLSGRILRPSLGQRFATEWTSSLGATHASPSVQPGSEKVSKTRGIFGRLLQMVFDFSDPSSASLKTSKDISRWGCPTSSKTWQEWVIERRGAYSARLNAVRRTSESGCSSWPTSSSRDWKGCYTTLQRKDGKMRGDLLPDAVNLQQKHGPPAPASSSTDGSRPGLWPTPASSTGNGGPHGLDGGQGARSMIPQEMRNSGKLNPRWVETLMGLPVGWTMPSCVSPVTIERTSCDSSAMESFRRQQNEPFEY